MEEVKKVKLVTVGNFSSISVNGNEYILDDGTAYFIEEDVSIALQHGFEYVPVEIVEAPKSTVKSKK